MPNPLNVPITPPRVAFIDPRTGNVSREWYAFFLSLFQLVSGSSVSLDDLQKGTMPDISDSVIAVDNLRQELRLLPQSDNGLEFHEVLAWLSPE